MASRFQELKRFSMRAPWGVCNYESDGRDSLRIADKTYSKPALSAKLWF